MKTILLLIFTVLVSSAPVEHNDKNLLGEIIDELDKAVKMFSKENKGNEIFLTKLQMDGCKREVFCQAEQELKKKVSGLSGAKFDHFRIDKKLMRNLNKYNERHVKTCKPADEGQDEILLHAFLNKLLTCVKSAYSQVK
uniref:Interleukin 13 n=1 Tax=Sinocyclocheilus grahami TaxID=75366 RepID=A0A672RCF0_SINGR